MGRPENEKYNVKSKLCIFFKVRLVQCILITSKNVYFLNIACTHFIFYFWDAPSANFQTSIQNNHLKRRGKSFRKVTDASYPFFISFIKHLSLSGNPSNFLKIHNFFILDPIFDPKTDLEFSAKIDFTYDTFSLIEKVSKQR